MTAASIAGALGLVRREGHDWRCRCPVCGGSSLTLADGPDGKLLAKCWGCDDTRAAPFPERPGAKGGSTSLEAANAIADAAPTLRAIVLGYLRRFGDMTADEIATRAGLSILTVRPRVSELAKLRAVIATDQRRPNASGHSAIVWRAAP